MRVAVGPSGPSVDAHSRRPKNKEHMIEPPERNIWIRCAMKRKRRLGPRRELREQKLRFGVAEKCLSCLTDLSQTIRCSHFTELKGHNTDTFVLHSESFRRFVGSIIAISPPHVFSDSRADHILDTTNFIHG